MKKKLLIGNMLPLIAIAIGACGVSPAFGAIKIRRPVVVETPKDEASSPSSSEAETSSVAPMAEASAAEEEGALVGTVDFVQGRTLLVEMSASAKPGERFNVFDPFMRRVGKASMLKLVDDNVYLFQVLAGRSFDSGYHLSRETEVEAAKYAIRKDTMDAYKRFLEFFPNTKYRQRMARQMFRLKMSGEYPTYPGNGVEGRIVLAEDAGREVSVSGVSIVIDKFIAARTDSDGRFRIEGIPQLDETVSLNMRVSDPKFIMAEKSSVKLDAGQTIDVNSEIKVKIRPAVLTGRVIDDHGAPMAGVEVWTFPYTREVLTDDDGAYKISRRKKLEAVNPSSADEPLFGGEYEIYAHKKGYSVQRAAVSAESFVENEVDEIELFRQDARREDVPVFDADLAAYLEVSAGAKSSVGGVTPPLINP